MTWLAGSAAAVLATLFPGRCGACRTWTGAPPPHGLCPPCWEAIELNDGPRCGRCDLPGGLCRSCAAAEPPFVTLRAPFLYGGAIAALVTSCKFGGREEAAHHLGALMVADDAVRRLAATAQCIVPVPLGRWRRWRRGFNQSAVLARCLARCVRVPVVHALSRRRETRPQSDLPLAERRQNVRQAFAPRRRLHGAALLVDDVVTSGETVRHAALALLRAGASRVAVVAAARAADAHVEA